MTRRDVVEALQVATRAAAAAGMAVVAARLLGLQFPLYALIVAVIVTDLSPARTRAAALPRLAGTLVGAGLGAALASTGPPDAWMVIAGILAAMFVTQLLLRDAAKLAGYVCAIVLLEHSDKPWWYALHRVLETIVGIAVAVLVCLVPKLIRMKE
jgi:uncharacterized membrane protein YgaE (UPF0421/DUF939 family)